MRGPDLDDGDLDLRYAALFSYMVPDGRCWLAGLLLLALAGCGGFSLQPRPMALYELGLGASAAVRPALVPARIEVASPPWLETTAMQYRLAWNDPGRRRAYAESRWVSPPAAMLGLNLQRALQPAAAPGRCRLHVDVDEFIQEFATAERSHARIVLRAALYPSRSETAVAMREFSGSADASRADASAGAEALRVATDRVVAEIVAWLAALDRGEDGALNAAGRCSA